MKQARSVLAAWLVGVSMLLGAPVGAQVGPTPVTGQHLQMINAAFARNGVAAGRVALDSFGRVALAGEYADEREVDRAFSLAQVVVGIKWVSPVTPENIRVKEWEKRLGNLFARSNVLNPPTRGGIAPGPIRNRYALVVGVGRFRYGIHPLEFAARDALVQSQQGSLAALVAVDRALGGGWVTS